MPVSGCARVLEVNQQNQALIRLNAEDATVTATSSISEHCDGVPGFQNLPQRFKVQLGERCVACQASHIMADIQIPVKQPHVCLYTYATGAQGSK